MIGVEYRIGKENRNMVKEITNKAEDLGVLLLKTGIRVLRIMPPLVINDSQVEKVLEVMHTISNN